uniref:Charged multivesicular body protein 7 n=1 Tax=Latimeria chalumnae TaxID=7897 RepID=H3B5L1_LATCH
EPADLGLPLEWEDDERMAFLFSAFKQNRDVNTIDWDSKIAFWTSQIFRVTKGSGAVSFTVNELSERFRRKGSVPLGLGTVIEEMIRQGKVQKEADFAVNLDIGWIAWGVGLFLVKPLKWTLFSVLGKSKVPPEESLVVLELVKDKADLLYDLYQNSELSSHPVVSFSELRGLWSSACKDERTFCLCLLQLQKEKKAMVMEQNGEKIVKFTRSPHAKVSPMNEVDIGVYQLMRSERMLAEKVELVSQEVDRYKEEARAHLKAGKKLMTLRCLKMKKKTEKRAESLQCKLDTIQTILDRIYSSQTDRMVIDAYEAGVGALKQAMKGSTVEKAESLVDQIQELCDTQDEINQTLSNIGVDAFDYDDSVELEEELKSLLEDKNEELLDLPDVPVKPLPSKPVPGSHGISDAELEAELNMLFPTETGMFMGLTMDLRAFSLMPEF